MITFNLIFAVMACVLNSGFQHGYNIGVTNAPQSIMLEFINETQYGRDSIGFTEDELTLVWALAVSIFSIGAMIGALMASLVAERLGRKRGLLVMNVLIVITGILYLMSPLVPSYETIIVGRFVIGVDSGMNACLAPLYLVEISPVSQRGAIGSTYQLLITIAILLSQILGLPVCLGTKKLWPVLFCVVLIPAVWQSIALLFCPESPKYLLAKGKEPEANKALKWLRKTSDIDEEKSVIMHEIESIKSAGKVSLKQMLTQIVYLYPLSITAVVMLSQQFSGINSIMGYSTEIFENAGLIKEWSLYATLFLGVINVIITVISMWLVEKMGRRWLFIIDLMALVIILAGVTLCLLYKDEVSALSFTAVFFVYLFVIFFASGIGPIPWFIVTEIFSQDTRSIAVSIGAAINWGSSFVVMLTFLPLKRITREYIFLIYAGLLILSCIFCILFLPETKNKSTEEIQKQMEARRKLILKR